MLSLLTHLKTRKGKRQMGSEDPTEQWGSEGWEGSESNSVKMVHMIQKVIDAPTTSTDSGLSLVTKCNERINIQQTRISSLLWSHITSESPYTSMIQDPGSLILENELVKLITQPREAGFFWSILSLFFSKKKLLHQKIDYVCFKMHSFHQRWGQVSKMRTVSSLLH